MRSSGKKRIVGEAGEHAAERPRRRKPYTPRICWCQRGEMPWYTRFVREMARRRWDWLRELVARQRADTAASPRRSPDALHDAIARLGLSDATIVDGLAATLGLDRTQVSAPDERALGLAVPEDLALLLPPLCEHGSAKLRELARAWLALPSLVYTVPSDRAEHWLSDHPAIADLLVHRIASEGLAWLGPEALARLASTGATSSVREAAARWRERLEPAA